MTLVRFLLGIRALLLPAALFLLGRLALPAAPTADSYEGRSIQSILFDPATQPLTPSEIDRVLTLKTGQPLHRAEIRSSIQALYRTGRYANIRVDATDVDGGVLLRFVTTQSFFIGGVTVNGVKEPPNVGQLVSATKLQLGTEFSRTDINQASENLLERLRANGFYNATITPNTRFDERSADVFIDFSIDPGSRARFAGVNITGNPQRSVGGIVRSTRWQRGPLGWFGWQTLTEIRLRSGLDNIRAAYQKKDLLLARVRLQRLGYDETSNRVTPFIDIDAGPKIRVIATGYRISKGRLKQLVPVFQEGGLDKDLLVEGRRDIIDYLQSQGYFDADVDFESRREKDQEVIEYQIDRNSRYKLVHLGIAGNKYFNTPTLRERMFLTPATHIRFRHGRYSTRFLEKDIDSIRELYRSNGFHDVEVKNKVETEYQGKPGQIGVDLDVIEGPQWFVDRLDIVGVTADDEQYLRGILHSTEGQPYSEFNVANDRDNILGYFYNNGFPGAVFEWSQETVPPAPGKPPLVRLRFKVNPGRRIYVRDVMITGLDKTNPDLVLHRVRINPGDPLSQNRIAESQRRLYDLGIFAKVEAAVQNPGGDEENKYVLYQFEEASKYSFNLGFGAQLGRIGQGSTTTFDAAPGTTGFNPRVSAGISRINFLGIGHTIGLEGRLSNLQQRALLSYTAPQFTGSERLSLTFTGLYDNSRDINTFSARRLEGAVQISLKLSKSDTLQARYTFRDVNASNLKINPQLVPLLSQSVRVGLISGTFIRDRRDDPTDAHKGSYTTIDLAFASNVFGSETDYLRALARHSAYHRIGRDLIFAHNSFFGLVSRLGGLSDIPLPERFFSGGSSSNRAFPDNQAGPRDLITGFPLGGKALLTNSFELRFPLVGDNLTGVIFHDAGNVYRTLGDISFRLSQRNPQDFSYLVQGVGFGIRYRTPVGPVRIDLSLSPDSPRFNGFIGSRDDLLTCSAPQSPKPCVSQAQRINAFQFHFSLGQAF